MYLENVDICFVLFKAFQVFVPNKTKDTIIWNIETVISFRGYLESLGTGPTYPQQVA